MEQYPVLGRLQPKSGSWADQWLIRVDVVVIFLILAIPFGLVPIIELSVMPILAIPGYIAVVGFDLITSPILPTGFLGIPAFYAVINIWFYFVAALLAAILRRLWRSISTTY